MVHICRRNPHIYLGGRIHRRPLMGSGMGSVLMNVGGAGGGSSYESPSAYTETTGRPVFRGGDLGRKLQGLIVKPLQKKPQNIKFEM